MTKRGRPRSKIKLTTGNDPALWRYRSVTEALQANLDVLAALVHPNQRPTPITDDIALAHEQDLGGMDKAAR